MEHSRKQAPLSTEDATYAHEALCNLAELSSDAAQDWMAAMPGCLAELGEAIASIRWELEAALPFDGGTATALTEHGFLWTDEEGPEYEHVL